MPDLTPEDLDETAELDRLIREALQRIIEHCDSCHITVTKRLENSIGETYRQTLGIGNSYASYGAVRQWVNEEEGRQRNRYLGEDEDET